MLTKTGLKYRTKNALNKRKHFEAVPFETSKTIGVILDDKTSKNKDVSSFIDELKQKHKVSIVTFTNEKTTKDTPKHIFSKSDFNWNGKILKKSVLNFTKTPFDFLISLNTSTILYVENVLALSQAKCRVGISQEENYPFLDFMIMTSSKTSWAKAIENIKHYTENIA